MQHSLPASVQEAIAKVDKRMRMENMQGAGEHSSLFHRLEYYRNRWSHGRRFEGWEGLLVTLLLALIYFGTAPTAKGAHK
jgi:hypothetical protein